MSTLQVWTFDTVETAGRVLEVLRTERLVVATDAAVTISWAPCDRAPRLAEQSRTTSAGAGGGSGDLSWEALFDAVFLEPLRQAERCEPPVESGGPMPLCLDEVAVNRLRDGVVPGHSALLVTVDRDVDLIDDCVSPHQPLRQWCAKAQEAPPRRRPAPHRRTVAA